MCPFWKMKGTGYFINPSILYKKIFSSASKHYVPTQFHLTTLFSLFPYLLIRVKLQLETSELQFHLIFSIFKVFFKPLEI